MSLPRYTFVFLQPTLRGERREGKRDFNPHTCEELRGDNPLSSFPDRTECLSSTSIPVVAVVPQTLGDPERVRGFEHG